MTEDKPADQATPDEPVAVETAPVETKPEGPVAEAVPVEAKPEEPTAEEPVAEAVPVEAKPEEPTPEAKPEEPTAEEPAAEDPATSPGNLGIWAFVLALLGLVGLLPIIGSVLGFVLGRVAVRQSDSRRLRGGRGLAVAAVTISIITLAVIVLSVAAYALIVAYLEI